MLPLLLLSAEPMYTMGFVVWWDDWCGWRRFDVGGGWWLMLLLSAEPMYPMGFVVWGGAYVPYGSCLVGVGLVTEVADGGVGMTAVRGGGLV